MNICCRRESQSHLQHSIYNSPGLLQIKHYTQNISLEWSLANILCLSYEQNQFFLSWLSVKIFVGHIFNHDINRMKKLCRFLKLVGEAKKETTKILRAVAGRSRNWILWMVWKISDMEMCNIIHDLYTSGLHPRGYAMNNKNTTGHKGNLLQPFFPFIAVKTSPGFVALPEGIFSASGTSTTRLTGNLSSTVAFNVASTHAAPPISPRIKPMPLLGFIEIPPLEQTYISMYIKPRPPELKSSKSTQFRKPIQSISVNSNPGNSNFR